MILLLLVVVIVDVVVIGVAIVVVVFLVHVIVVKVVLLLLVCLCDFCCFVVFKCVYLNFVINAYVIVVVYDIVFVECYCFC